MRRNVDFLPQFNGFGLSDKNLKRLSAVIRSQAFGLMKLITGVWVFRCQDWDRRLSACCSGAKTVFTAVIGTMLRL